MKISTRGRYGLRLLVDIAEHSNEGPIALTVVAKRQDLSEKYLQQVALLLTRGGFLTSVKGSGGGYLLERSPASMMIYDVLDLLEGNICFEEPVQGEENAIERVIRLHVYQKLDQEVKKVFEGLTLADVTKAAWFTYVI
ncbi:RrF2 family transcriptional regulator [Sphaerochaeta globosa]|uniref:Transcriptional regulator, BadM/Rrf2 family n=1 Tax=Sphaerochaeta globosa (strain ATCC BAA-1886 / DSM 22777 / Buddy) TaxID=158189 RepID=F0RWE0_SPHGB|nr:Rrf2 family transcriptional regulator [Sphaerochaeta globosa]ADY13571.1 transcriptional regulator, BadM/Rrf2 family [Sphaerochaeta globosa str. Buddy]